MFTSHFFKTLLVKKNFTRCFRLQAVLLVLKNTLPAIFRSTKLDRLSGFIYLIDTACMELYRIPGRLSPG